MCGHVLHFLNVQSTNESKSNETKCDETKGNKRECNNIELVERQWQQKGKERMHIPSVDGNKEKQQKVEVICHDGKQVCPNPKSA